MDERIKKIMTLWSTGLSASAIAERMGVTRHTIVRKLKSAGVDVSEKRQRYDSCGNGASTMLHDRRVGTKKLK